MFSISIQRGSDHPVQEEMTQRELAILLGELAQEFPHRIQGSEEGRMVGFYPCSFAECEDFSEWADASVVVQW